MSSVYDDNNVRKLELELLKAMIFVYFPSHTVVNLNVSIKMNFAIAQQSPERTTQLIFFVYFESFLSVDCFCLRFVQIF